MAQGSLDIVLPGSVTQVAERFRKAGGTLFIVGGWLRDLMRGAKTSDIDFATDVPTEKTTQLVQGLGRIYTIGEKFGTIGLITAGLDMEITTLRSDVYTPGSRHPDVSRVAGVEEDLSRRDFTINAMAFEIAPGFGPLIDPFDGRSDLIAGIIRTPGPPEPRMAEDPLRMMRAVRFAAQLGFEIDRSLLDVLEKDALRLDTISRERRRDELEKILISKHPDTGVRLLVDTGLMERVCPEVADMNKVEQPRGYHRADVLGHALLATTYVRPDPLLRRAALFHDLGKPEAMITEPKVAFPEHEKIGAGLTRQAMKRLHYGNEEIQKTEFLVRRHMRPIHYEPEWKDSAVRRLIRDCTLRTEDEVLVPLSAVLELARADVEAGALDKVPLFLGVIDDLEQRIADLGAHHEITRAHSPLGGDELMEMFDRPGGPWIRPVKDYLTQKVVDGELSQDDKAKARELAIDYMKMA